MKKNKLKVKKNNTKQIKDVFNLENLIFLYIIMLPILDMSSFIFKNKMKLDKSPISIIRPLMLGVIFIISFFKLSKKSKIKLLLYNFLVLIYTYFHLKIFKSAMQGATIYPLKEELRFIAYYTFGTNILLFIYYFFKENIKSKKETNEEIIKKEKIEKGIKERVNKKRKGELNNKKLNIAILISSFIYLFSLYLTMYLKKASFTYADSKTGYKGFYESGNVLSNILVLIQILSILIFLEKDNLKGNSKKIKSFFNLNFFAFGIFIFTTIYSVFFLGTRTGKYSSILLIIVLISSKIFILLRDFLLSKITKNLSDSAAVKNNNEDSIYNKNNNNKLNNKADYEKKESSINFLKNINLLKKILLAIIFIILILITYIFIKTKKIKLQTNSRVKYLEENQKSLLSEDKEKLSVTLDIHNLNKKIQKGEVDEKFLSSEEQKSLIETEKIAKSKGLIGYKRRNAQTIYHVRLVKNQNSIKKIVFGNGHLITYGEMILEREILAIILNFGLMGMVLFLIPIIYITIYFIYNFFKYFKFVDTKYIIAIYALLITYFLSYYSGAMYYPMSASALIGLVVLKLIKYFKKIYLKQK